MPVLYINVSLALACVISYDHKWRSKLWHHLRLSFTIDDHNGFMIQATDHAECCYAKCCHAERLGVLARYFTAFESDFNWLQVTTTVENFASCTSKPKKIKLHFFFFIGSNNVFRVEKFTRMHDINLTWAQCYKTSCPQFSNFWSDC